MRTDNHNLKIVDSAPAYRQKHQRQWPASWKSNTLGLEEDIAWFHGVVFTGINIKWRDDHWFIVIKGLKQGHSVVAFLSADCWEDVWETLTAASKNGWLEFKEDRFK
jgi:hypothetical protein